MDPLQLKSISKWAILTKEKDVPTFISFTNYYCQFITNYSAKARSLINLTKNIDFTCGHIQQNALDEVRIQFLLSSIVIQFDRTLETNMHTNASISVNAGILSQYHVVDEYRQFDPV